MTYEYKCPKCNRVWEVNKTLIEYEKNRLEKCECGTMCKQVIYPHGIRFIGDWETNDKS